MSIFDLEHRNYATVYRPFVFRPNDDTYWQQRHSKRRASFTANCSLIATNQPPSYQQHIAERRSAVSNFTTPTSESTIFYVPVVFQRTSASFQALTPIPVHRCHQQPLSAEFISNNCICSIRNTNCKAVWCDCTPVARQSELNYQQLTGHRNNSMTRRRVLPGHATVTATDDMGVLPLSTDSLASWNATGASSTTIASGTSSDAASIDRPVRRRAYFCIILLFLVNLLNYMDRYTIAGILDDVKQYYTLDVKSLGLIQTVFICSYMILAPIFGFLGDRYNRRLLLTFGIFMWSVTTFLGSLIPRGYFGWFLFLRAFVGIGEASYSTVAPTIIADMFAKKQRSKMLAFFYFAIPVGSGLGYIVGSKVAALTGSWQYALRVTPVLGIILDVCIFVFLEDPPRGMADGGMNCHSTNYATDLKSLIRNKSYIFSTLAFTCCTFAAGGIAMFAPEFMRLAINQTRKMDGSSVSLIFGVITCLAGFVGVALGSISSQRFGRVSLRADPLICAFGMLVCTPFLFFALWLSRSEPMLTWFLIFTAEVFLCLNWPLVADMMLYCVAPMRRGTAGAFQILVSHALGDAGSPYLIGVVADAIGQGAPTLTDYVRWQSMQYALFITCFVTVLSGGFFLLTSIFIEKDRALVEYELDKAAADGSAELRRSSPADGRLASTDGASANVPTAAAPRSGSIMPAAAENQQQQSSPLRRYSNNYATFNTAPPTSSAHRPSTTALLPDTPPPPYLSPSKLNPSCIPASGTQETLLLPPDTSDGEQDSAKISPFLASSLQSQSTTRTTLNDPVVTTMPNSNKTALA